jgi:hypothetical protein
MATNRKAWGALVLLFGGVSCSNHKPGIAAVRFDNISQDFNILRGGKYQATFGFTNTGSDSLVLKNVTASCACTGVKFTRGKIAPGDAGSITVEYSNAGDNYALGPTHKLILVESNTQPMLHTLSLHGSVKPLL